MRVNFVDVLQHFLVPMIVLSKLYRFYINNLLVYLSPMELESISNIVVTKIIFKSKLYIYK